MFKEEKDVHQPRQNINVSHLHKEGYYYFNKTQFFLSLYAVISCNLNHSGSLVSLFQLFQAFIIACRNPEVCHIHGTST